MLSLETSQSHSGSFKTKVAAAVAATAAIGAVAAITMSSSSSVARKTTGLFNIPEDIKGHFSGGQLTGEWTVQGKFHKFEAANGDWQINSKLVVEGPRMGGSETYTLVDNVLVMVPKYDGADDNTNKMECGDRENLPAYTKWADALDSAQMIPERKMTAAFKNAVNEKCPAGASSVLLKVDDRDYVICADSTANTRAMYAFNGFHSFSAVSREGMTVNIEHPKGWEALNCTVFDASKTREEAANMAGIVDDGHGRELQLSEGGIGEFSEDSRVSFDDGMDKASQREKDKVVEKGLAEVMEEMFAANAANNLGGFSANDGKPGINAAFASEGEDQGPENTRKACAFYHGVGGLGQMNSPLLDFFEYWGHHGAVGRYCKNTLMYHNTDSAMRGYNSLSYHQEICTTLSSDDFSDHSNSVIFTHSMGGLTTRRAFADGVCQWGGHYWQSNPPMDGSKAVYVAEAVCILLSFAHLLGLLLKMIMLGNYCRPGHLGSWPGFLTIGRDLPTYPDGGATAMGRLCGSNPKGLGGFESRVLRFIQMEGGLQRKNDWCMVPKIQCGWRGCRKNGCYVWWRMPYNDGMVAWNSCAVHWTQPNMQIQRTLTNHADGTGRNGDRSGGIHITKWFQQRAKNGAWFGGGGSGGDGGAGAPGNGWGHRDEVEGPVDNDSNIQN